MAIQLPVLISPTRAETAARCERRHFIKDVLARVPELYENPSADFGTVMHAGAAEWWRTQSYKAAKEAVEVTWSELRPSGDKHSLQMAHALFDHYAQEARLSGPLYGSWEIYQHNGVPMIEQRLHVEEDGVVMPFQIDRLLVNSRGELALIDLKTATRIDKRWHGNFDRWLQGKLYAYGVMRTIGKPISYLVVEGLQKSVPSRLVYHTPPYWDEEQLEEAWFALKALAERDAEILRLALEQAQRDSDAWADEEEFAAAWRDAAEQLGVTRTVPNYHDCWAYNQPCPYLPLCERPASERIGRLRGDYAVQEEESWAAV